MKRLRRFVSPFPVLCALAIALLPGCNPNAITGVVYDIQGEALPGVVVQVEGSEHQDLTNALGEYRVPFHSGPVVLQFVKTGYTPGLLKIDDPKSRRIAAADVKLWNLPQSKGVYFYSNFRYSDLKRVEPKEYSSEGLGSVYGTTEWCDIEVYDRQPTILCYKLPPTNVALCRMELIIVEPKEANQSGSLDVWTRSKNIPMAVSPIDEPEGLLLQFHIPEPLEPGSYAIHWGALDGVAIPEPRIFMFTVVDPETRVLPADVPEQPETTEEKKPEERPKPKPVLNLDEGGGEMSG